VKRAGHIADLLALGNELVALIQSSELEAAAERVSRAKCLHIRSSTEVRAKEIGEIIRTLTSVKTVCSRLRTAVEALPANEQIFAKTQIEEVIDRHFTSEINELRRRKRELSKPC
jgi:hypothetical protein